MFLINGRITHGCQFADPAKRRWATSYYGERDGVGRAIRYFQKSGPIRVGAIGLGAARWPPMPGRATSSASTRSIPKCPHGPAAFTYLTDCRGTWEVVLGDARLSLEAEEPPQQFDLLVFDAFSGDAIPTHLLDPRGVGRLPAAPAPKGAIAVHIATAT